MSARSSIAPAWIVAAAAVLLVWGVSALFKLRFARGDVYPAFSTLRADPLGAKALHDALAAAGLDVARHYRGLQRGALPDGTVYVCGIPWAEFVGAEVEDWAAALAQVERGGRLVVTFAPEAPVRNEPEELDGAEPGEVDKTPADGAGVEEKSDPEPGPAVEPEGGEQEMKPPVEPPPELLVARLGIGRDRLPRPSRELWVVSRAPAAPVALPESMPWHTALAFDTGGSAAWRTILAFAGQPVALERDLGAGTIVLVADGFLLSNEALAHARETALLAWLQGPARRALFDESHLGVNENRGVATLARRYGLGRVALVLLVVALLFVWRNSSSLVPSREAGPGAAGEVMAGRETAAGFVNLLRRTLPARELLPACLAEFRRSNAWRRLGPGRRAAFEEAARETGGQNESLAAVRRVHEVLSRRI